MSTGSVNAGAINPDKPHRSEVHAVTSTLVFAFNDGSDDRRIVRTSHRVVTTRALDRNAGGSVVRPVAARLPAKAGAAAANSPSALAAAWAREKGCG